MISMLLSLLVTPVVYFLLTAQHVPSAEPAVNT